MYKLRKEDASVNLYLKDIVLAEFIEFQEKDSLVYSDSLSNDIYKVYTIETEVEPSPFARGRGIVYFDDLTNTPLVCSTTYSGTPEQSTRVVVYDDSLSVIPDSSYIVDYLDGKILMVDDIEPFYIDYYWNYVGLLDEWSLVYATKPPVIVLDINATKKEGFQLGGGKKIVRKGSIYVFATNASERKDLEEIIYDKLYLKSCALYDFPKGTVLDYDGTFYGRKTNMYKNYNLFSRDVVSNTSNLKFENIDMKHINLPITDLNNNNIPTSINAYRSRINFDLVSYVEG